MSKVYISETNDNGIIKWELLSDINDGKVVPYEEDFMHILYDSEGVAKAKLDEIEAERQSEDSAEPFTIEEARTFAEKHQWKFATTYAKTAPHEYLVKRWLDDEDKRQFERFVQTINKEAVVGYFYGHPNKYLILGDHYYWYMPIYPDNMAVDLINRTTTDYLEYRDGVYYYRDK